MLGNHNCYGFLQLCALHTGAQGVVVNLDYFAELVKGVTDAPVAGIADAGWLMDLQPISKNTPLSTQQVRTLSLLVTLLGFSCGCVCNT